MTTEELDAALTRAYNEGRDAEWQRMMQEAGIPQSPIVNARLDRAGRLAVARYSAERQQRADNSRGHFEARPLWMDE